MKIRLVFIGLFFGQLLLAQTTNSDLIQLKNHPQKDTTRCFLLNKVIEAENDHNIWIKYNQELQKIALDNSKKKNNKTLKIRTSNICRFHTITMARMNCTMRNSIKPFYCTKNHCKRPTPFSFTSGVLFRYKTSELRLII